MAEKTIKITGALHAAGTFPVDDRLLLSKAQMLAINEDLYPDQYLCICTDDHKVYIFDYSFEKLDTTGKFRSIEEFINFTDTPQAKENIDEAIRNSDTVADITERLDHLDGGEVE